MEAAPSEDEPALTITANVCNADQVVQQISLRRAAEPVISKQELEAAADSAG